MQTWDAIRSRRNVRRYDPEPLVQGELDRILEAGRRAPSSQNQQRWDFVVVTDRRRLQELSEVWRGAGHVADSAATVVLVAPDLDDADSRESVRFDLGQAAMNMMLAAADLGIGSGHAAVRDHARAREVLALPQDRFAALMLAFGQPADRPLAPVDRPDRRPFDDVVHREQW